MNFMTNNIQHLPGQINLNTNLGQIIYNLVLYNRFKNIVDIGTWNGLGTTTCILKALETKKQYDTNIYTIELYPDMIQAASVNLNCFLDKFHLYILHGRIVDINDVNSWFDHSSIDLKNDDHAKLWYHKDMELIQKTPNIISKIPDKIDLLVLDGGEYSTYPEWNLLKDRTRFFVLDDTNILKCKKIKEEILNNNKYTIIHDVTNDRNGYLVGYRN